MAPKSKPSKSITLDACTRLKPEGIISNTTVFTAEYEGQEFLVTMSKTDHQPTGDGAARFGQPWSRLAQVFQWRSKKPGNAALRTEDGELSGYLMQLQVSKYHADLDNRPTRTAVAAQVVDDGMPF